MSAVVLIGMPGSGKSTLGVLLAKELGWDFTDTDLVLQHQAGRRLQDLLEAEGYLALRAREEEALLTLGPGRQVIATGGSAVYSHRGMAHLAALGTVVYLRARLETLRSRVRNWAQRGLAAPPGTDLAALYAERTALYETWADHTLDVDAEDQEALVARLASRFRA